MTLLHHASVILWPQKGIFNNHTGYMQLCTWINNIIAYMHSWLFCVFHLLTCKLYTGIHESVYIASQLAIQIID